MNISKRSAPAMTFVVLLGIALVALAISFFSEPNPNSLLTGRWLLTSSAAPNAKRYLEFSASGNVTAYKMDGKTIDAMPGHSENWTVKGNVIESILQRPAPAKPLLTIMKEAIWSMFSGDRVPLEPTLYTYEIEGESTLQLKLLDSAWPHGFTLTRVSASNE